MAAGKCYKFRFCHNCGIRFKVWKVGKKTIRKLCRKCHKRAYKDIGKKRKEKYEIRGI